MHRLRWHGWMVREISQPHAVYGELSGFPDVIAFKAGHTLLVECKRPGGKTRKSQDIFFSQIERHERITLVCVLTDSVDAFAEFLRKHEADAGIVTVREASW